MERVIMMKRFFSFPLSGRAGWGQAGQAHTEYGLILVLVGITVIGALTIMGQQVGGMWHTISASMPH
jgi:Flp pilus assembly pilin Flp